MHTYSTAKEVRLRERFRLARAFVEGSLGYWDRAVALRAAGVSSRMFVRDVQRARQCLTFEDWRPKKRGPPAGIRQSSQVVRDLLERLVYDRATEKLNVSALARAARSELRNMAVQQAEIPSSRTIARHVEDIIRADAAHFATTRYGRRGRFDHTLQLGSLEAEHPLQIVCIDHTPCDNRALNLAGFNVLRPWATAAFDVATGVCLAAFLSPHAPSANTVAICLALISSDKTSLLKSYGIPGSWEAAGIPQTIFVDGGVELSSAAVRRGCERYGISLKVGPPGSPHRRGGMERFWRTLNSEIHTWPGSTLSNAVELERHGGQRDAVWDFEQAQYRLLIAVMEYNNETYGQPSPAPIAEWRRLHRGDSLRLSTRDPNDVFIDFLPSVECSVKFSGVRFKGCDYRSGDIASLRYRGVRRVELKYDPRDLRAVWIDTADGQRFKVPRVYPKAAPHDLHALKLWNAAKAKGARDSRDEDLLAQLYAAKQATRDGLWPSLLERLEGASAELVSGDQKGDCNIPAIGGPQLLEATPIDIGRNDRAVPVPQYSVRLR